MPCLSTQDFAALAPRIRTGRMTLALWGLHDGAQFLERRIGLPISLYLDSVRDGVTWNGQEIRRPDVLTGCRNCVVIFSYYWINSRDTYTEWLDRHGIPYLFADQLPTAGPGLVDALAGLPPPAVNDDGPIAQLLLQVCQGGAERQMILLGTGLRAQGLPVRLVTLFPPAVEAGSYLRAAAAGGLPIEDLSAAPPFGPADLATLPPPAARVLAALPEHYVARAGTFYRRLADLRPRAVVCYLDLPNILGGIAALAAGVPRLLLSGRNRNPSCFPHLFGRQAADLRPLYQALLTRPEVTLTANSASAARDYAQWLDLAAERVTVVPNACAAWALDFPLQRRAPSGLVLGLFRLSPEKRPLDFIRVFARVAADLPHLRGRVCGVGPMEADCRALIASLGLGGRLEMAGAAADPALHLAEADLLLHTADAEGLPNAVLEAQAMGVPVVAARAEGTLAALAPPLDAWTAAIGDEQRLAGLVRGLLADSAVRDDLGRQAAAYVRRVFTPAALTASVRACIGIRGDRS
jgi:glycosyltransferase involved in cell wall biosynthesis